MTNRFSRSFTAGPEHIDVMGHVNNAVWVQWVQDMAGAHWDAAARPEDKEAFVWLVIRHEIDYRGNITAGETAFATSWIPAGAKGVKSTRRVDFANATGKVIVSANTTWAMLDRESGRLARVRPEVMEPFAAK